MQSSAGSLPFIIYSLFMAAMLLLNGLILLTPYLASQQNGYAPALYAGFAPTCHQLTSRSLCLAVEYAKCAPCPPDKTCHCPTVGYSIADCTGQNGTLSYSHAAVVQLPGATGYKFPVCSRDVAIYLSMLIGGLLLPFIRRVESETIPPFWLLALAILPLALDGTTQLFTLRESTNLLRILTGAIAGFALPFYLLPMLNFAARNVIGHMPKPHKRKR